MAYELKAIFEVQDRMSAKVRKITQEINKLDIAFKRATASATQFNNTQNKQTSVVNRVSNSFKTYNNTINNTSNTINRNTSIINHNTQAISNNITQINHYNSAANAMRSNVSKQASTLGNLRNMLLGVATAYIGAQGAAKAFNVTIGAAAQYEQQSMALAGMIGDAKLANDYLKMVEKTAVKSPVLNSTEMMGSSKAFVGLTKDISQLEKIWGLVERIQAFSGVDTHQASFSTKELFQGDYVSMYDAIGLDKKELQKITKMGGLDKKVNALDKLLNKMGVNQKMVDNMGNTTLGLWSQLEEKAQSFFRKIGESGNTKLGGVLRQINSVFDSITTKEFIAEADAALAGVLQKAIDVGKFLWKWREPVMYVTGAIAGAMTALVGVGIIAALANPISLIAAGITAAAVGMKALYDNSATFRGMIDGIVSKAKELWSAFQSGGTSGLLSSLLPPSMIEDINRMKEAVGTFVTYLAEKWTAIQPTVDMLKFAFQTAVENVVSVLSTLWNIAGPILSVLGNAISIIGDVAVMVFNNVIAPAIAFNTKLFQILWTVVGPILELLGACFKVLGTVIMWLWDTIVAPFVDYWTSGLVAGLNLVMPVLDKVGGMFKTIGSWISSAAGHVSSFADTLSKIKIPDWVQKLGGSATKLVQKMIPGGVDGSHYHGLSYVPTDNYVANLHRGEKVLTASEAKSYDEGKGGKGGGVTITGNTFNVREESDIKKIAYELSKLLEREAFQYIK